MYLISYDLRKVKNYLHLYECLVSWRAQKLIESLWVADLKGPSKAIRDTLTGFIDDDDSIVVIELPAGVDWATVRAQAAGVGLLKALGPRVAA